MGVGQVPNILSKYMKPKQPPAAHKAPGPRKYPEQPSALPLARPASVLSF